MTKRLLLVDDDPDIRETMSSLLEFEGYETILAQNGKEALALALAEKPDKIILDMWMPIMSGMEFCEQRKRIAALREIPVIACSADKSVQLANLGVQCFLHKPVSLVDLLEAVETCT